MYTTRPAYLFRACRRLRRRATTTRATYAPDGSNALASAPLVLTLAGGSLRLSRDHDAKRSAGPIFPPRERMAARLNISRPRRCQHRAEMVRTIRSTYSSRLISLLSDGGFDECVEQGHQSRSERAMLYGDCGRGHSGETWQFRVLLE